MDATTDIIPPIDNLVEYNRGIPDEERERRSFVEEGQGDSLWLICASVSDCSLCLISIVFVYFFSFVNYLPAEMEAGVVRVGIPPRGRDREVVPLSEFNRDFAEDVGGLGRAKYSIDSFFII